ncbi:MAG: TonB-dependent receptor [Elusimicrobia bacterium]|nr:TonB-dependent receptor [Candidatus Liberimonas magnetica]
MKVINAAAAVLFFLCSSIPVYAENLLLDEIVIRGQKEALNQESLNMREVRESPARDVGEALRQVEGINIVRKCPIANDVVLRGFQRDNINVLSDGARLHGACPNRMDTPAFHFDFAEIEQIKIIKGPYDLTNPGSLAGMIDIVTKKPRQGLGADLNLTHGSYNSINDSAVVSYGTEKFDALAGYAYKSSEPPVSGDGKTITDLYGPANTNRYRTDTINSKAYEANTSWAKVGANPTANSHTDISYSYQNTEHVLYPGLTMDSTYDRATQVNWAYEIKKLSSFLEDIKFQGYWDKVDHLMDNSLRAFTMAMSGLSKTQVYGGKANASFNMGTGVLKSGIDYYNRKWDAKPIPDVSIDNSGIFAVYTVPVSEKINFEGGVRADSARANPTQSHTASALPSPANFSTVGGNLQLTCKPSKEIEIFAGVAKGNRTPDPEELFMDRPLVGMMPGQQPWKGNPDLRPVSNNEADLGAKYALGRFYINATMFYSSLTDFINVTSVQLTPAQKLMTYENIEAYMWGGELGSQWSLPLDLFLKGGFSYTRGYNKTGGRPLSEIPPLKGTLALRYDNGSCFLEADQNMAARQTEVDSVLQEQSTDGYETTDIKAGCAYKDLSVYVGVNNLFDKYYFSYLSYTRNIYSTGIKVPENGRNFYITVSYRI